MTLIFEFGSWITPCVEHTLFGRILHIGWVSVAVFDGRLSDKLFAWRRKLEQAVRS